jgi:putative ABC transport system permease protein
MYIWSQFKRNKKKLWTTLATIALGTFLLLTFRNLTSSTLSHYAEHMIHGRTGHAVLADKRYFEKQAEQPGAFWIENPIEVEESFSQEDRIKNFFPRASTFAFLSKSNKPFKVAVQGNQCEKEISFFKALRITSGRCPKKTMNLQEEVIVGAKMAESRSIQIGDSLTLSGYTFAGTQNALDLIVVGTFESGDKDIDTQTIRVDLKTLQQFLDTEKVETYSLELQASSDLGNPAVLGKIQSAFEKASLQVVPFYEIDPAFYKNTVTWLQAQNRLVEIMLFVVLCFSISSAILMIHMERRNQYGILLAHGDTRLSIFQLMMLEATSLGLFGAALGTLLQASLVILLGNHAFEFPPPPGSSHSFAVSLKFFWTSVFWSAGVAIAATLTATAIAFLKVVRKSVSELLRSF